MNRRGFLFGAATIATAAAVAPAVKAAELLPATPPEITPVPVPAEPAVAEAEGLITEACHPRALWPGIQAMWAAAYDVPCGEEAIEPVFEVTKALPRTPRRYAYEPVKLIDFEVEPAL